MEEVLIDIMDRFLKDLSNVLQKALTWSAAFKLGQREYGFDIDTELFVLSEKYHVDFKKGDLLMIYTLADYYCDAIKHDVEKIGDDYPVKEAASDIGAILTCLESREYKDLELPSELVTRLRQIFDWVP